MNFRDNVSIKAQSGVVLVVSLIILLLLTLIGVMGMQTSGLEEKMTGNLRDRAIALQAAEAALSDAEREIDGTVKVGSTARRRADCNYNGTQRQCGLYEISLADCGASTASDLTDDGVCDDLDPDRSYDTLVSLLKAAPSVEYGAFTGEQSFASGVLSAKPRYLIESIKLNLAGLGEQYYYRITVRAQGANSNTVVVLQEIYK